MTEIIKCDFKDTIIIHFGGTLPQINAYTLATTLTYIADAAKAANEAINPGYDIEIVVEALGGGSFKAQIKSLYRGASNLFTAKTLKEIVIAVIASYIFQHTLAPDANITVIVNTNEVVVEQGDKKIIVPRDVHEAMQQAEQNPNFKKGVGQVLRAVDRDQSITSIGFGKDFLEKKPPIEIPRENFKYYPDIAFDLDTDAESRDVIELVELEIVRAILERSRRRWEFVWNGIRISAPILDKGFYDSFIAHHITVAPGDVIQAYLRICQKRIPDIGVYQNNKYEVIEVVKHIPRPQQGKLIPDEKK
jgi:hypothetical protein